MVHQKSIIFVGGPAGSGKSTIASLLSDHFHVKYVEGDDLHSKENVEKMSNGIPLEDEDRWPWLHRVCEVASKESEHNENGITVVTCSMLKKSYRDLINKETKEKVANLRIILLFLYLDFNVVLQRVKKRADHYMKSDMVQSQYSIMEIPANDELISNGGNSIVLNISEMTPDEILQRVINTIEEQ